MWHPMITRGLRAVARMASPDDAAMHLLTATGSVICEQHRVELMAEFYFHLLVYPPDPRHGKDVRKVLSNLRKLLPTAPLGVCFNE